MKICIAGSSGFIGRNLQQFFFNNDIVVLPVSRKDIEGGSVIEQISGCEVLVNLMGESVSGIWTKRKKRRIYDSRVLSTGKLVEWVNIYGKEIKVFISLSGIGIYDLVNKHDETSSYLAGDFLSDVIRGWENELLKVRRDIRVVVLRLGVVLGKGGGMLKSVTMPFRYRIGFIIKSAEPFSFIHIGDLFDIMMLIVSNKDFYGVVNVVAPVQSTIIEFFTTLSDIYKCRVRINISPALTKAMLGKSSVLVTNGQYVIPGKLIDLGYSFKYGNLKSALKDIVRGDN